MQGHGAGGNVGVSRKDNKYWNRLYQKQEPAKDEVWFKLYLEVESLLKRAYFLYQRIIGIKLLIPNTLDTERERGLITYEMDLMDTVFMDKASGYIRAKYSDKTELVTFREELNTLIQVFDSRFFELLIYSIVS